MYMSPQNSKIGHMVYITPITVKFVMEEDIMPPHTHARFYPDKLKVVGTASRNSKFHQNSGILVCLSSQGDRCLAIVKFPDIFVMI